MKRTNLLSLVLLLCFLIPINLSAQEKPGNNGGKGKEKKNEFKKYEEVVPKDAKTSKGLFIVHQVKDKYYFEIPFSEFNKDFLLVTTQAKTQAGVGYQGDAVNQQIVRWERFGDKVLLKSVLFASVAADSLPISYSVKRANQPAILMAFGIQTFNDDSTAAVIEVNNLFTTDVAELGMNSFSRTRYKVKRLDTKRSFVDFMKAFPNNLEIEATLTYDAGQVPDDRSLKTISITMHNSMVRLPEKPMMPRLEDKRVGYFSVEQYDYGIKSQKAEQRTYISRWRLEPKDTAAFLRGELVEPVKPIVFYIGRGVPDKWRPWLHKAVEAWNVAFEKAGFKNAIIAKDPPSEKEDPYWSSDDARYSVIRWLPSNIENAYGPHISDPRTGEILDADIGIYHNVMNLARDWYFVQVGDLDSRASKLPLPDSLMGQLLKYVVTHEVGHSLGFPHNMKASSQYPVDSLRSATFTAKYGDEASIMDYGRFNYVAQPGDNARLIPMIGPYDKFAVEWGYRPIIGAKTPDDEKPALDKIAERQETEPYLRFGSADGIDPTAQTEDLGDDAVKATTYGLKNLKRISDMLLTATTKPGKDYSTLSEIYDQVFAQRTRELGHVANVIGGVVKTERVAGQQGVIYTPLPKSKQKTAMDFLQKEGFTAPKDLIKKDVIDRVEPTGTTDRVLNGQKRLLSIVLDNDRMDRMVNTSALNSGTYTLSNMLSDLQNGIWSELRNSKINIDIYRRNLQRAYLDEMNDKLNPKPFTPPSNLPPGFRIRRPSPLPGEARSLIREELSNLDARIKRVLSRSVNTETKAHLQDSRDYIKKILFPEK